METSLAPVFSLALKFLEEDSEESAAPTQTDLHLGGGFLASYQDLLKVVSLGEATEPLTQSADNSGEEAAEPILDNMEQVLAAASSRLTTFVQWLRCSFRRYRGSGWHENLSSSGIAS